MSLKIDNQDYSKVKKMAHHGMRNEEIADVMQMSVNSLKNYFSEELKQGRKEAIPKVVETAYKMATSGSHPSMTMFWLKCRARWKENFEVDDILEIINKKIDEALKLTQKENRREIRSVTKITADEKDINCEVRC